MRLPLAQNCHKRVEIFDKKPIHDKEMLSLCYILNIHAERVANGSTRASRLQAVENAQNVVDNYGSTASQAVSSGVSKITSDALRAQDNSINDIY